MSTQFGLTAEPISTPYQNKNIANKQEGVNMAQSQSSNVLDKTKPGIELLKTVAQRLEMIKKLVDRVSYSTKIMRKKLIDFLKSSGLSKSLC
jgi:hypothetical protein